MHPWRHLRAGIFVVERMSLKLAPGQQVCKVNNRSKIRIISDPLILFSRN